jgi:hypothetical protein
MAGAACPASTTSGSGEGQQGEALAPTIEAAEQQLALLYRRMRAYLRDPYDYAESRITSELAFEQCLDLAVSLNICMSDLSGAASAGAEERDRIRGLILQGLLVSHRLSSRPPGLPTEAPALSPDFSRGVGASGLRIGESSSATKTYRDAEEVPDADGV